MEGIRYLETQSSLKLDEVLHGAVLMSALRSDNRNLSADTETVRTAKNACDARLRVEY